MLLAHTVKRLRKAIEPLPIGLEALPGSVICPIDMPQLSAIKFGQFEVPSARSKAQQSVAFMQNTWATFIANPRRAYLFTARAPAVAQHDTLNRLVNFCTAMYASR